MIPMKVVRRMRRTAMPSAPKSYFTPSDGIQSAVKRNWNIASPVAFGSNLNQSTSETKKSMMATMVAVVRIAFPSRMKNKMTRAPIRGM